MVETWDLPARPIGHVVGFPNAACTELLVAHLVAQGLSRIAYLGGGADGDARAAARRRGFMAAPSRAGSRRTRRPARGGVAGSPEHGIAKAPHLTRASVPAIPVPSRQRNRRCSLTFP